MAKYAWNDDYTIGVEVIDAAHKQLLTIIQKMMNLLDENDFKKHQFACKEGIKFLKRHMLTHFAEEEEYMRSIQYQGYEKHKLQHDRARDYLLPSLEADLIQSDFDEASIRRFLGMGIGWLTSHLTDDMAIVGKGMQKTDLPGTTSDITRLETAITDVIRGTFKLSAKLLDEHYDGQGIGDAVYYETQYKSQNSDQVIRLIVIWEERLIFQTVGILLSATFNQLDVTVLSAVKEVTQMIFQQIGRYFREESCTFQLVRDQVLTREHVQNRFDRKPPRCGLLFETQLGYFVVCVETP